MYYLFVTKMSKVHNNFMEENVWVWKKVSSNQFVCPDTNWKKEMNIFSSVYRFNLAYDVENKIILSWSLMFKFSIHVCNDIVLRQWKFQVNENLGQLTCPGWSHFCVNSSLAFARNSLTEMRNTKICLYTRTCKSQLWY